MPPPETAPLPKLFVSHSSNRSKDDAVRAEAMQRLQETCEALCAHFDVLVDQGYGAERIYPSEDWDQRLCEWMAECDAAVILFSRDALESYWVQQEVHILRWRHRLQKDFVLVPVFMNDLTDAEIRNGLYGPVTVATPTVVQGFKFVDATDTATQVKAAWDRQGNEAALTPFEELRLQVEAQFAKLIEPSVQRNLFADLANNVGVRWTPDTGAPFASAITRLLFRDPEAALKNLDKIFRRCVISGDPEKFSTILKELKGLWVDLEAAGQLAQAASVPPRFAALNADEFERFTGDCYVRRAWTTASGYQCVPITANTFAGIVDEFAGRVREPDLEGINELLEESEVLRIVLLPPSVWHDSNLITRLTRDIPNAFFFAPVDSRAVDTHVIDKHLISPQLNPRQERSQRRTYETTVDFLNELRQSA